MALQLNEGKYAIQVQTLKKNEDEPSAMNSYLGETAILTKTGRDLFITFMLKEQQIISSFQLANDRGKFFEAIEQVVNEQLKTRYEMFKIKVLKESIIARVQYELFYEGQKVSGDEQLRLMLDQDSLQKVENMK